MVSISFPVIVARVDFCWPRQDMGVYKRSLVLGKVLDSSLKKNMSFSVTDVIVLDLLVLISRRNDLVKAVTSA